MWSCEGMILPKALHNSSVIYLQNNGKDNPAYQRHIHLLTGSKARKLSVRIKNISEKSLKLY